MENSNNFKNSEDCKCSGHSCAHCNGHIWHGGKHVVLRWILGIAILAIVFGVGVKVGEFKTFLEGSFDGGNFRPGPMMMWNRYGGNYNAPDGYYPGPGMMRWYFQNQPGATTTPR